MKRLLFLILVLVQTTCFANLTPIEKRIEAIIQDQKNAQVLMLEKLVNINSGTDNRVGVMKIGAIMEENLRALGFKTHWFRLPPAMHHADTLIAKREGKQGKKILLIGHLDTVFSEKSRFQRYEPHADGANGPGVLDDKGGLVTLIFALKALHMVHALDDTTITVVLTGDEEDSGKPTILSRKGLREAAKNIDVALDFEPGLNLDSISIGRRGITNWTIETSGKQAHSAGIFTPAVGAGAIFELARILNSLHAAFSNQKTMTVNPGIILGGTQIRYDQTTAEGHSFGKQNVVAKTALAKGDIRFLSPAEKNLLETKMRAIVEKHLPQTNARISFEDGIPSMPETEQSLQLLNEYSKASLDLGYGKVTPLSAVFRGAGDISHVASIVPAKLAGLGPIGYGAHTTDEHIEMRSLSIQTKRAALLIYRLTR